MSKDSITIDDAHRWLIRFEKLITENEAYLTELDSAIGDADHGGNMARGVKAVAEKLAEAPGESLNDVFKTVGMTLVTSVGGASGPLYGTFFLRLGMTAGAVPQLDGQGFAKALRAALGGVEARGKAEVGDKTMIDALSPALDAFESSVDAGGDLAVSARKAAEAAAVGRDSTTPLVARKGRASYLAERSAGHLDPGAVSSTLLVQALADSLEEE